MSAPAGLLVVDKPAGPTSHDVVARVRRLARTRKVGHAGTLDPMATGVLVLGLGRATRLLGHLVLTEKAYDATIRLGVSTTTDDAEGEVLGTAPVDGLTESAVRRALAGFVGEIEQVPTSVSAIRVAGRRAHDLVRTGEAVRLAARPVTVHELVVHAVDLPDVRVSLRCSSGTYVRAIARDLGERLGVGGHLVALRRTAVGPFTLDHARTLDELAGQADGPAGPAVLGLDDAARLAFAAVDLDEQQADHVRHGRRLALDLPADRVHAVFAPGGEFLALYRRESPGTARAVAVLAG